MKNSQIPPPPTKDGSKTTAGAASTSQTDSRRHGNPRNRNRRNRNRSTKTGQGRLTGCIEGLEGHIFDFPIRQDEYTKTIKEIAGFVGRTFT